jgi:O-ureido-D-serine cyclo-ligase
MRIALAGCLVPTQEDPDAPPLERAFVARGHSVQQAGWDDPRIDWSSFDAVLLRSTWNYHLRRDDFLAWASHVEAVSALWNPLPIVRWNTHKFYLRDLEARGVAIVPTAFLPARRPVDLVQLLDARGWARAVLKPAVSADSYATMRVERRDVSAGQRHLEAHLASRDMLVQPYLMAVEEPGEHCLVFIEGEHSHAVRKRSLFLGGRHAGPEGVVVLAAPDEVEAAGVVLAAIGLGDAPPLYARLDFLRDAGGTPRLLELELVEPSLFFDARPVSAARLVEVLEERMRRSRPR